MFEKGQPCWYAVQTSSGFEATLASHLAGKGIESYCPELQAIRQSADHKNAVRALCFPGYVFARFVDCPDNRIAVLQSPGAVRILGMQHRIASIAEEVISGVRQMTLAGPSFIHPYLRDGSMVSVRRGPLAGISGYLVRVRNNARLVLSLDLLARSVAAEIDLRDLDLILEANSVPQEQFAGQFR